jgi:hypothetical protein
MVLAAGHSPGINDLSFLRIFRGERRSVFILFRRQGDNVEWDHEFFDGSNFRLFGEVGPLENVLPFELL